MKKITQRGIYLIMTLVCATSFAQMTGVNTLPEQAHLGIQDKSAASGNDLTSVLVVGAPGDPLWIDDVEAKLDNSGLVDADTYLSNTGTPTIAELQAYDAVLLFTDAGAADPAGLGNNLAAYIDAGGAVVDATFTPNVPITGGFTAYELYSASGQSNGANLGIGTVNDPAHPTMLGVSSFDGGTSSYHNTGGTLAAGAVIIAEYTTGAPLVIVKENVGPANVRRVFLNFYPPSTGARADFWDASSDGDILMANALNWASKAGLPSVLVAASPGDPAWAIDVKNKVESSGEYQADVFNSGAGTPTLAQLENYDAVFVFTDAGSADPVAFGNVLADYADGGGFILDATFTANVPITGNFLTTYALYTDSGQSNGTNLGIGTINDPTHPTLDGVSTFDGGTASYHNSGGTVAAGAIVVAEYTTGEPLIIISDEVGPMDVRRAFLNFYPPSIDARDDFWDTTSDGALIITNTITWLLTKPLGTEDNATTSFTVYPNPASTQITIAGDFELANVEVFNILGQNVMSSTSKTLNIDALTSAIYLVKITDVEGNSAVQRFVKK